MKKPSLGLTQIVHLLAHFNQVNKKGGPLDLHAVGSTGKKVLIKTERASGADPFA